MAATMKTIDGTQYPASDFLVVADPQKVSTWHLQVKKQGTPDHGLMGAAKAALTSPGGHMGNPYAGPNKAQAIVKLKALYKAEGMAWDDGTQGRERRDVATRGNFTEKDKGEEEDASGLADPDAEGDDMEMDEGPTIADVHVNAPLGGGAPAKRSRYLPRLRELVEGTMASKGYLSADDWLAHQRTARGHAGGKARSTTAAEGTPAVGAPSADYEPCPACKEGNEAGCACPGCASGGDCWCCAILDADGDTDGDAPDGRQAREWVISAQGDLFAPLAYAEAPEWIPYLPKPGRYKHTVYGDLVFSRERNADFVKKFNAGVYQTHRGTPAVPIDAEHETKLSGACGWIEELRMNADGSADARVDWTDRGRALLASDRFRFFSPEIYDQWRDTVSGRVIKNVAIGGALTTRPYFKSNAQGEALRPLAASERAIFVPDETEAPRGRGGNPMTAAVQLTEEQIKRFADLEAENAGLKKMAEANAEQAKQAVERVAALERDARRKAFTEQARAWHGDTDAHVTFMEGLSDEQRAFYATQQDGLAAMLKDSLLFKEIGRSGVDVDGSAEGKLRGIAQKMREADPTMTAERAYVKALDANPDLYARSLSER